MHAFDGATAAESIKPETPSYVVFRCAFPSIAYKYILYKAICTRPRPKSVVWPRASEKFLLLFYDRFYGAFIYETRALATRVSSAHAFVV